MCRWLDIIGVLFIYESIHTKWRTMNKNVLCSLYLRSSAFATWWTPKPPLRLSVSSPLEGFLPRSFFLRSEVHASPLWSHRTRFLPLSEHFSCGVYFSAYPMFNFELLTVEDMYKGKRGTLESERPKWKPSSATCCVTLINYLPSLRLSLFICRIEIIMIYTF